MVIVLCLGELVYREMQRNAEYQKVTLFSNEVLDDYVFRHETFSEFMQPAIENFTTDASSWFDMYHALIHIFLGGNLGYVVCAQIDPVFYLFHASIDEIYEEWRSTTQITNPEEEYFMPEGILEGYSPDAPMIPFTISNKQGLSNVYTDYRYEYGPRPSKIECVSDDDCDSILGYLWCNECSRCVSKIKPGGVCTGMPNKACYCNQSNSNSFTPSCADNFCECL